MQGAPRLVGGGVLIVSLAALSACGSNDAVDLNAARTRAAQDVAHGSCSSALAELTTVLNNDPQDVSSLRTRGKCYLTLGNYTASLNDLSKLFSLDKSVPAGLELASAQWTAGQVSAARQTLRDTARGAASPVDAVNIADRQLEYGDPAGARSSLQAVQEPERDFHWYVDMGRTDGMLSAPEAFEQDFAKARTLVAHGALGYVLSALGDVEHSVGRYGEAVKAFREALSVGTSIDALHVRRTMADSEDRLGDLTAAAADFQIALQLPDDAADHAVIQIAYARTLLRLGRLSDARTIASSVVAQSNISAETAAQARTIVDAASSPHGGAQLPPLPPPTPVSGAPTQRPRVRRRPRRHRTRAGVSR
jgi:tetratricopeptide (TPR) repeat protein